MPQYAKIFKALFYLLILKWLPLALLRVRKQKLLFFAISFAINQGCKIFHFEGDAQNNYRLYKSRLGTQMEFQSIVKDIRAYV